MRDFRNILRVTTAVTTMLAATTAFAQQAPKHHSKLKGAIVGGAVGSAVGHPKLGAAAGVMHQHGKNKKAAAGAS